MKVEAVNLLEIISKVINDVFIEDDEVLHNKYLNLIDSFYIEIENIYKKFCVENNEIYNYDFFDMMQEIFAYFNIYQKGIVSKNYQLYSSFCDLKNIEVLSLEQLNLLNKKIDKKYFINNIKILKESRKLISHESFTNIITFFAFLAIIDNKEMKKDKYQIIISLLDEKVDDICPFKSILELN